MLRGHMEPFWGASILKCSVRILCFSVSQCLTLTSEFLFISIKIRSLFYKSSFCSLPFSLLWPQTSTWDVRATLGPADCGQMNRESLGKKQQPQMIRGAASLVIFLLIPADPVQTIINLTSVLNCFKLNLLFTEIIPETLEEVLKEDIIWLTEN